MSVIITQSRLRPVVEAGQIENLQRATSACAPGMNIECELYTRPFSGSCSKRGGHGLIRVATLAEGYPLAVDRFIGKMAFPHRLSATIFLAMHEAYHFVVGGLDERADVLCDSVAYALQNDLGLYPPTLLSEPTT